MNVGIYLTDGDKTGYQLAAHLVRSIRRVMPPINVVQLTDETSGEIAGANDVQRLPIRPLSLHRAAHFAQCQGDWLFLDTDTVVQKDVRDVFDQPFDIAVVDRHWTKAPNGQWRLGGQPDYIASCPYNAGVVFSRCPQFWQEAHRILTGSKELQQRWTGDQIVLNKLADSGRYHRLVLPGMIYNFPPESAHDPDLKHAAIAHYKGKTRKPFLLARVRGAAA